MPLLTIISGKALRLLKPENIFKKLIIFLPWSLEHLFSLPYFTIKRLGYYSCGTYGTYGVLYKTKLLLILLKIIFISCFMSTCLQHPETSRVCLPSSSTQSFCLVLKYLTSRCYVTLWAEKRKEKMPETNFQMEWQRD